MKKAYWIVAYRTIFDPAALQAYGKIAVPAIEANGGKVLVRAAEGIHAFEAGLPQRTVLIEFESIEKALAAYNSDDYKVALQALGNGVERDFRIVEGLF